MSERAMDISEHFTAKSFLTILHLSMFIRTDLHKKIRNTKSVLIIQQQQSLPMWGFFNSLSTGAVLEVALLIL